MAKSKAKVKKKPAAKAKSAKPVAKKKVKPAKKAASKAKKPAKPVKKAKPVAKKKTVTKPKAKVVKTAAKKAVKAVKKAVKKKVVAKKKPVAKKIKAVKKVKVAAPKKIKEKKIKEKKIKVKKVKPPKPPKLGKDGKPVPSAFEKKIRKDMPQLIKRPLYITQPKPIVIKQKPAGKKYKAPMNTDLRYSDKELREFKDLIDKKLVTAREELKYLKEALENHNDNQAGSKAWNMEEGSDTSEMETLMNQISRQHAYIRNLELALVRIENKTYGICRITGKLIPKQRLRIVPHATLSLEAKMNRVADDTSPGAEIAAPAPPADFAEGFED